MGELVGSVLGSFFWVWLFGRVVRWLGAGGVFAAWGGYGLAMVFAVAVGSQTGVSEGVLILYGVFGLAWAFWFSLRWRFPQKNNKHRGGETEDEEERPGSQCPACSRKNDPDADFCVQCGQAFGHKTCAGCDTENVSTAVYCKRCGARFSEKQGSQPSQRSKRAKARSPKRKDFSCFDCGAHVRFGASHCGECGAEFRYSDGLATRAQ